MTNQAHIDPEQWQISLHSRHSGRLGDTGHAFMSLSKGGRIVGSAGLAFDLPDEMKDVPGGPRMLTLLGYKVPGKIFHEFDSLTLSPDVLRSQTFDITPAQALKAITYVNCQKSLKTSYHLYSDNCSTWALAVLRHVGVDTSPFSEKGNVVQVMRPGVFHAALCDAGLGRLQYPPRWELLAHPDNDAGPWLTRRGALEFKILQARRQEKLLPHWLPSGSPLARAISSGLSVSYERILLVAALLRRLWTRLYGKVLTPGQIARLRLPDPAEEPETAVCEFPLEAVPTPPAEPVRAEEQPAGVSEPVGS